MRCSRRNEVESEASDLPCRHRQGSMPVARAALAPSLLSHRKRLALRLARPQRTVSGTMHRVALPMTHRRRATMPRRRLALTVPSHRRLALTMPSHSRRLTFTSGSGAIPMMRGVTTSPLSTRRRRRRRSPR